MAALNVPSLADVKAGSSAEEQPMSLPQASQWTEPVTAALAALLEALHFARDLGKDPWEFAVEIVTLHRLGVSNSGLRWLVARNLVSHGIEVTGENDAEHPGTAAHGTQRSWSREDARLVATPLRPLG